MITIISSTNQRNSGTAVISRQIQSIFNKHLSGNESIAFLNLEDLPVDAIHAEMYSPDKQSIEFISLQDNFITPADKYFFVMPEYNGSFPGILKTFIDACSVRNYKATFAGKKAGMVGLSSGRAGNLRGIDQLSSILNFLEITVMPQGLPISRIESLIDDSGKIVDKDTLEVLEAQIQRFIKF